MFWLFSMTINNLSILASFGFTTTQSNFVSFLVFTKLYEVVGWITNIMRNFISRHYEYQADQFSAKENRVSLAQALIRLNIKNAGNLNPDRFYSTLKFSHPSLTERLNALGYVPPPIGSEELDPSLKDKTNGDFIIEGGAK